MSTGCQPRLTDDGATEAEQGSVWMLLIAAPFLWKIMVHAVVLAPLERLGSSVASGLLRREIGARTTQCDASPFTAEATVPGDTVCDAKSSRASAMTCLTVKPNCSAKTAAGAEAPKRSMPCPWPCGPR